MKTRALMAKTHPSEYLIHKYWARKPHNILKHYLETFFKKGDLVVDPFCGSGVFLAEAKKLNISAIGMDINPIAYLISEVTTNPPDAQKFAKAAEEIIDQARSQFSHLYTLEDGTPIRYLVHLVKSKCSKCGNVGSIEHSKKKSSRYYCEKCDNKLSFNFENFSGTEIIKIIDKENHEHRETRTLNLQKRKSELSKTKDGFNKDLVANRRILAFPGMKLADLFTPRAFNILSELFNEASQIKDVKVRNAIILLLTSGTAQCSRLIPFRNNLKTGGPAWTIPGFWIAPLHLETNPIIHLEARYKKFLKGMDSLNRSYSKMEAKVDVKNISAQRGLRKIKDGSIDGIFFDPPYGDNVPYVEFSAIWNGFLDSIVDYQNEIVVSDRKEHASSWDKYASDIENIIGLFFQKLKKNGLVVMTFNNLDPRAWKIVLEAFAKYSFFCREAKYQIPAVVSSKAQTAANTSYIGDYYCVFEKNDSLRKRGSDLFYLTQKLEKVLLSRSGKAPINLLNQVAILTILNENLSLDFIEKIDDAITPIAIRDGDHYILRDELRKDDEGYNLENVLQKIAVAELSEGKKDLKEFYETILARTDEIGSPHLSEVKSLLKGAVLFEKDYCYLQKNKEQPALF